MINSINTGDVRADQLLAYLLARADQFPRPELREDVRGGAVWLTYSYSDLLANSGLNLLQLLAAFSHLQAEGYVETDLTPCNVGPRDLGINKLRSVCVCLLSRRAA